MRVQTLPTSKHSSRSAGSVALAILVLCGLSSLLVNGCAPPQVEQEPIEMTHLGSGIWS